VLLMTSRVLSYAAPNTPVFRRWFMRAIEDLSGRRRLLPLYLRWRAEVAGKTPRMWSEALSIIGTQLKVSGPTDWHTRIPSGPLVVIANHPFGIADGITLLSLAERIGRPYRILLNADFMRLPEIEPFGLPIDFSHTKEALATNLKTRADARRLLKEGVTIAIFPAGGVATAEMPFGQAEELPWKRFVVRLVQQTSATVLPVYFEGQNSPLFHLVSRYSLTLRLSLLVREFRRKVGTTIQSTVGSPVVSALAPSDDGFACIDQLYLLVHHMAPDASSANAVELLPRPLQQRRRYPREPPRGDQPNGEPRRYNR
jgi:putative hemolysin